MKEKRRERERERERDTEREVYRERKTGRERQREREREIERDTERGRERGEKQSNNDRHGRTKVQYYPHYPPRMSDLRSRPIPSLCRFLAKSPCRANPVTRGGLIGG